MKDFMKLRTGAARSKSEKLTMLFPQLSFRLYRVYQIEHLSSILLYRSIVSNTD